jgi:hypothetical protein
MQAITQGYGKIIVLMDGCVDVEEIELYQKAIKILTDTYPCVKLYRMEKIYNSIQYSMPDTVYEQERKMFSVDIDSFLGINSIFNARMELGETYNRHVYLEDLLLIKESVPKIFLTRGLNPPEPYEVVEKIRKQWIYAYTRSFPSVIWNDAKDNTINLNKLALLPRDLVNLIDKMFATRIYGSIEEYDFPIL